MSNLVSTTNQLYITIKNVDTICIIPIRSTLCSELVMKAEIERKVFGL